MNAHLPSSKVHASFNPCGADFILPSSFLHRTFDVLTSLLIPSTPQLIIRNSSRG
jgi:hypothetical protein